MPCVMALKTPSYLYYQMKVQIVEQILRKEMKVTAAARALGKSRQIIHRWIQVYEELGPEALYPQKPGPKKGSPVNRTPEDKENLVLRLAEEHPFEGPLPLSRRYLEETNEKLNSVTVWRIIKRIGHRYGRPSSIPRKKPVLYVKSFPGEEIQMDSFYPFGRSRKLVSFDAIDDHSRWPESKLYETREEKNAIHFLHYLVARAPFAIRVVRTDRGREFSGKFTQACRALGIEHIRNKGYSPENNGKIERWHRTLREDLVRPYFRFNAPIGELQYLLGQWLNLFRFKRPHTGLGMNGKTPAERLIGHYSNPTHESVNLILQQNMY